MTFSRALFLSAGLLALAGCENLYQSTLRPDYTIRVMPTEQGSVAVPPECPSWNGDMPNPFDNQPLPQFGCTTARNLAAQIENPDDLIEGRTMGKERAVTHVGAIRRHDNNQTRGLILPTAETSQAATTTSSAASSSMTGDVTGGTSAGASAPVP